MTRSWHSDLGWSAVTPESRWRNRRQVLGGLMGGLGAAAGLAALPAAARAASPYSTDQKPNTLEEVSGYNNFYEFGTGKGDPAANAGSLTLDPWAVEIGGLVERPGHYDLADLLRGQPVEERIYRLRCVEAWSMVIPWLGFPLSGLLERVGVRPSARFVAFQTLLRPEEMPGQRYRILNWPYREGLRLDEAMHPLTLIATGLYGTELPPQNGAPLRLVVPWKYGFKSIKSIVKIELTEDRPLNSWQEAVPSEYGFYANVNPEVDHPRWSQASERVIGAGLFAGRAPTLPFNGYGDLVADLYAGMDLHRDF